MGLDGRFLAQARERLAETKLKNADEMLRRKKEVYARVPRIREMDTRLRAIMAELFGLAMGSPGDASALERESLDIQMRRAELLEERGFGSDYLCELCDCAKCCDTGYVMGKMCSCLKKLYDDEVAKSLSSLIKIGDECFEKFDFSYYDDAISPKAGVSPRRCMETVYATCRAYAEHFSPSSINLLLRGGPGLGKTFLSACIARTVANRGRSVVYETAGDAVEAFEEKKFSRFEENGAGAKVSRMLSCELLILDDLGTEMPGAFASGALYSLINTRLTEGKSMIISTNLSKEELKRRYTPQIASRLEGEFHALEFSGRDIRIIKKERGLQ